LVFDNHHIYDEFMRSKNEIDDFVTRWSTAGGSERANYQLFIADLCRLLELPPPEPACEDKRDNGYVFETRVTFAHGDGSTSADHIDCDRRGTFVLEAKNVKAGAHIKGFDDALLSAPAQAESYACARPATEGRPPFLVVVDAGHVMELYAEFTRSGAAYTPCPDVRSHRLVTAVAEVLTGAGVPLPVSDLEARFTARGQWRDRATGHPRHVRGSRASAEVAIRPLARSDIVKDRRRSTDPYTTDPRTIR
jgi:hypothetical protein